MMMHQRFPPPSSARGAPAVDDFAHRGENVGGGGSAGSGAGAGASVAARPVAPAAGRPNEANPRKLFIGGLHFKTDDASLCRYFSQFGEVEAAQVSTEDGAARAQEGGAAPAVARSACVECAE